MARMTREDWAEMVEQADTLQFLSQNSVRGIFAVIEGTHPSYDVFDFEGDKLGTFTVAALSKAWTEMAAKQGLSGIEYYQSGDPDSLDYSAALEIAIAGEVVYG